MKTVKRYLDVYRNYWAQQLAVAASFRVNFVLMFILDLLFYAGTLLTIDIIFRYSGHIGDWNREQFMLFAAFFLAIDNGHMTFVAQGFWVFATNIRTGQLDHYLVKPVHPLFSCFMQHCRPSVLLSAIIPWGAIYYYALECQLSLLSMAMIPLLWLAALILMVTVEIAISMLNFITIEGSGINFVRMQLQAVGEWPDFIYSLPSRLLFTFLVPVLIVVSFPVTFLLDNSRLDMLFGLIIANIVFFWLMIKAWNWGSRRYQSASS